MHPCDFSACMKKIHSFTSDLIHHFFPMEKWENALLTAYDLKL
jgi:hypothetical protein